MLALALTGRGAAWAVGAAVLGGDPDLDCGAYRFPAPEWAALVDEAGADLSGPGEERRRELARSLVRCDVLGDMTAPQVRRLLGRPTMSGGRPLRAWDYAIGRERGLLDAVPVTLHLEFERGRVVYVAAPSRRRGGGGADITTGRPAR